MLLTNSRHGLLERKKIISKNKNARRKVTKENNKCMYVNVKIEPQLNRFIALYDSPHTFYHGIKSMVFLSLKDVQNVLIIWCFNIFCNRFPYYTRNTFCKNIDVSFIPNKLDHKDDDIDVGIHWSSGQLRESHAKKFLRQQFKLEFIDRTKV